MSAPMSPALRTLACNPAAGLALLNVHQYLSTAPNPGGVCAFDALRVLAVLPVSEDERRELLQLLAFGDEEAGVAASDLLGAMAYLSRVADVHRAVGGAVQSGFPTLGGDLPAKLLALLRAGGAQ